TAANSGGGSWQAEDTTYTLDSGTLYLVQANGRAALATGVTSYAVLDGNTVCALSQGNLVRITNALGADGGAATVLKAGVVQFDMADGDTLYALWDNGDNKILSRCDNARSAAGWTNLMGSSDAYAMADGKTLYVMLHNIGTPFELYRCDNANSGTGSWT